MEGTFFSRAPTYPPLNLTKCSHGFIGFPTLVWAGSLPLKVPTNQVPRCVAERGLQTEELWVLSGPQAPHL